MPESDMGLSQEVHLILTLVWIPRETLVGRKVLMATTQVGLHTHTHTHTHTSWVLLTEVELSYQLFSLEHGQTGLYYVKIETS